MDSFNSFSLIANLPNTHIFTYNDICYPFNLAIFNCFSDYFVINQNQINKDKKIILIDDDTNEFPEEIIQTFIDFCQRKPIQITNDNAILLNVLAQKFNVTDLISKVNQHITQNQSDLFLDFLLNDHNEDSLKTIKYEKMISQDLSKYIDDEKFIKLPIPVLHRIFSQSQNCDQQKIENFLFKCFSKNGRKTSALFDVLNITTETIDRLFTEFPNEIDFHFVNQSFIRKIFEQQNLLIKHQNQVILQITQEKQKLSDENHRITIENQKMYEENQKISKEKQMISDENQKITQENQRMSDENKKITQENHRISIENQKMSDENQKINKENQRITQENQKIFEEKQRISDENQRMSEENKKMIQENQRISEESQRVSIENQRLSEENQRISKEKQKMSDENQKITKQNQKMSEEKQRITEENQRISEENKKITKENQRTSEENQRISEENQKITKENQNLTKENQKISKEKQIISDENQRMSEENKKMIQENQRISEESQRVSKENQRLSEENQRIYKENQRIFDENQRIYKENLRVSDENKKITKENQRISDENQRIFKEKLKVSEENQRMSEENKKIAKENQKISDENQRISKENQKIIKENQKMSEQNQRISKENQRISEQNQRISKEKQKISEENQRITLQNEKLHKTIDELQKSQKSDNIKNFQSPCKYSVKSIVVGDPGTGKSNLISRFIRDVYDDNSQPTLGIVFYAKAVETEKSLIELQIWDTAGQELFRSVIRGYFRGAAIAYLVFDITQRSTFDNLERWISEINECALPNCIIVLIGNKSDLAADRRQVSKDEIKEFAKKHKIKFMYEASAKTNKNFHGMFTSCLSIIDNKISNFS